MTDPIEVEPFTPELVELHSAGYRYGILVVTGRYASLAVVYGSSLQRSPAVLTMVLQALGRAGWNSLAVLPLDRGGSIWYFRRGSGTLG